MNKWSSGVFISKRTLTAWYLSGLHFMSLWFKIWSTFKVAKRVQCTFYLITGIIRFLLPLFHLSLVFLFGSIWKQNPTVEKFWKYRHFLCMVTIPLLHTIKVTFFPLPYVQTIIKFASYLKKKKKRKIFTVG